MSHYQWQFLLVVLAGWVNRHQQEVTAYLQEENRVYRDPLYSQAVRHLLRSAGVRPVRLPPRSPNLNAYAERFVRSIKSACVERMIFFSEAALLRALTSYAEHYHHERNHQGMGNRLLEPGPEVGHGSGPIECHQRLGGLLRYYHRRAA